MHSVICELVVNTPLCGRCTLRCAVCRDCGNLLRISKGWSCPQQSIKSCPDGCAALEVACAWRAGCSPHAPEMSIRRGIGYTWGDTTEHDSCDDDEVAVSGSLTASPSPSVHVLEPAAAAVAAASNSTASHHATRDDEQSEVSHPNRTPLCDGVSSRETHPAASLELFVCTEPPVNPLPSPNLQLPLRPPFPKYDHQAVQQRRLLKELRILRQVHDMLPLFPGPCCAAAFLPLTNLAYCVQRKLRMQRWVASHTRKVVSPRKQRGARTRHHRRCGGATRGARRERRGHGTAHHQQVSKGSSQLLGPRQLHKKGRDRHVQWVDAKHQPKPTNDATNAPTDKVCSTQGERAQAVGKPVAEQVREV